MNNSSKIVQWGLAVLVALLAIGVTYADEGLYFDGAVGRSQVDNSIDGIALEDDSTAYRFGLGFDLGNDIALEGAYVNLGDIEQSLDSGLRDGQTDGFTVNGRFSLPLSNTVAASARVGMFFWESEITTPIGGFKNDGEDIFYGVGLDFEAARNLTVAAQWDRFEFGDSDADVFWAGLRYRFGR